MEPPRLFLSKMVTDRALEFLCGDWRTFQKYNHICITPPDESHS
jgi:hypothetical protein